jgi:hypothetical protein
MAEAPFLATLFSVIKNQQINRRKPVAVSGSINQMGFTNN